MVTGRHRLDIIRGSGHCLPKTAKRASALPELQLIAVTNELRHAPDVNEQNISGIGYDGRLPVRSIRYRRFARSTQHAVYSFPVFCDAQWIDGDY